MKMTFSVLEDKILNEVLKKPQTTSQLLELYVGKQGVSRAGFYKALSTLKRREVVLVKKSFVTVSKIWLADSYQFFKRLSKKRGEPSYLAHQVDSLKPEEELLYYFRSISDIDIFLINLIYDLLLLSESGSVLIEESHEFFLLLNHERTDRFLDEIKESNNTLYLLVHSSSEVDKKLLKEVLHGPAQGFVTGKTRTTKKIVHAVGDVIIEVDLADKFFGTIHSLYIKEDRPNDALREKVEDASQEKHRHRIRIYKDAAQTTQMRARFKKYFTDV